MEQKELVVILADISGYTRFMLENQTAAVHGQLIITGLIESIIAQVDIPLTLQEIEGDAVFLYAERDPAHDDAAWRGVLEEVSAKLDRFFHAFIGRAAIMMESTPCSCAICRNSDQLGLKIIVHLGSAVFHSIAGRPQVSGPDVILAHRLLKNTLPGKEYLLLSSAAHAAMGDSIGGEFVPHREHYEGFGAVELYARSMDPDLLAAREALYRLPPDELEKTVSSYSSAVNAKEIARATVAQLRRPVRSFTWREKLAMLGEMAISPLFLAFLARRKVPAEVRARGRVRTEWAQPARSVQRQH